MPDIEKTVTNAILKINPNAEVTVRNIYDIDNCEIEWLNGTTPISIEDIKVEWDKFVPGSSVFIPSINTVKAVNHVVRVNKFTKRNIISRVTIEDGKYGVRVWRKK